MAMGKERGTEGERGVVVEGGIGEGLRDLLGGGVELRQSIVLSGSELDLRVFSV